MGLGTLNNDGKTTRPLGAYVNPYTSAPALLIYLNENYKVINNPSPSDISLGDVVFVVGGSQNYLDGHSVIITKIDADGTVRYSAHNNLHHNDELYVHFKNKVAFVVKMGGK